VVESHRLDTSKAHSLPDRASFTRKRNL